MAAETAERRNDRRGRSEILQECVHDTVRQITRNVPSNAVRILPNAGVLVANCYFLISDAYKLRRGMQDSRTHPYKVAAFTVAAIMAVRPIRVVDTGNVIHLAVAQANQQCAMRAAQALLGLDLEKLEEDFLRRMYASVFAFVELPCLSEYVGEFDKKYSGTPDSFENIEASLPFDRYNRVQFNPDELAIIETLINQFDSLEKAHGHPFRRLLLGWRWLWT